MSQPFDPDAYLAAKAKQAAPREAFDPNAYLARKSGRVPGALETGITSAAQAPAFGFVDELSGVTGAGIMAAKDVLQNRARPDGTFAKDYRSFRDAARGQEKAGDEAHPTASKIGTGVGIGLTALAPLPKGKIGTSAALGALGGLGGSEADLTEGDLGGAAIDATLGAGIGAAAYGAAKGAGKLAGRLSEPLRRLAVKAGRRVLTGGADSLSGKAPVSDAAVTQAIKDKAIRIFGTTEGAASRLEALRESAGAAYGDVLETLEKAGVQGPDALALADQLATAGRKAGAVGNTQAAKELEGRAMQALDLPEKGAEFALSKGGDKLGLTQAEAFKRTLQKSAKYGGFEETLANEAKREAASSVRQAVEEVVAKVENEPGATGAAARAFVPVKQRLSNLIEAGNTADKGVAQAARRQALSLRDLLVGSAMGGGTPLGGAAATVGSKLARGRGASTVAAGLYGAAGALERGAAPAAEAGVRTLGNRQISMRLQALIDALRGQESR